MTNTTLYLSLYRAISISIGRRRGKRGEAERKKERKEGGKEGRTRDSIANRRRDHGKRRRPNRAEEDEC